MNKLYPGRMERMPFKITFCSVKPVADHRMAEVRHVHADLVGTSREKLYFQKRRGFEPLEDPVARFGGLRRFQTGNGHLLPYLRVPADRLADMAFLKLDPPPDNRQVRLGKAPVRKLGLQ